ncbi:MAG: NYN domain-containing protein [Gammaproteobacteria bacterium]|nr:NYN domain-containing protein [Gammaproteobacteria bacterium]MDH5630151.1 NYN domain-containing protein [Gammaproteobacteria bacterium]
MEKQQIAVFIDADNAPAKKMEDILSELAKYGVVNIRKAYGNWTSAKLNPWAKILHEYSIQPFQQFDMTKGKNASDIAMVIDVMDVIYTKNVDVICIVSSDCDFTPLVVRTLSEGKVVIGFGERKTPDAFVKACSKFLYLDDSNSKQPENKTNLKSDSRLINLLRQAVEANEDEDGWANLSPIGSHIANQTSFDQRNYGFAKLSDLIKAIDLFELKKGAGNTYLVKDKRKKK